MFQKKDVSLWEAYFGDREKHILVLYFEMHVFVLIILLERDSEGQIGDSVI